MSLQYLEYPENVPGADEIFAKKLQDAKKGDLWYVARFADCVGGGNMRKNWKNELSNICAIKKINLVEK